ncbi:GSCOCG00001821001-RA-CDS [Cotesia congregata]|nr:GSCOCG00001821001-RA-CDS [Cotesia congregata]
MFRKRIKSIQTLGEFLMVHLKLNDIVVFSVYRVSAQQCYYQT